MLYISFDLSLIGVEGAVIAVVGYLIVFIALVVLVYVFNFLPKILKLSFKKKVKTQDKLAQNKATDDISGEVSAAISMALHLYFNESHDEESNVMTIKRVSETYTPWSSKIYGLRTYQKPHTAHK